MQDLPRQMIVPLAAALLLCAGRAIAAPEALPGSRGKEPIPKRTFTLWDQAPPPSPPVTPAP